MSHFVRKGSAFGGKISELAITSSDAFEYGPVGRLLTAVRDSAGHLKLIAWGVSRDGTQINRIGEVRRGPRINSPSPSRGLNRSSFCVTRRRT
jgi:hypothetical protein